MRALAEPGASRREQLMSGCCHQGPHLLPRPARRPGAVGDEKGRHLSLERRRLAGREANKHVGAAGIRSLRGDPRRAAILLAVILRRSLGGGIATDDFGHDAAGFVALDLVRIRAAGQPGKRGRNQRPSQHENPSRPRARSSQTLWQDFYDTPSFLCRLVEVVVYWKMMRLSGLTTFAAACAIRAASWKPERMSLSLPG